MGFLQPIVPGSLPVLAFLQCTSVCPSVSSALYKKGYLTGRRRQIHRNLQRRSLVGELSVSEQFSEEQNRPYCLGSVRLMGRDTHWKCLDCGRCLGTTNRREYPHCEGTVYNPNKYHPDDGSNLQTNERYPGGLAVVFDSTRCNISILPKQLKDSAVRGASSTLHCVTYSTGEKPVPSRVQNGTIRRHRRLSQREVRSP